MENKEPTKNVVRIKDIAELANVSTGTVDRVLHNRGRVSEEVKQRVLSIARELNYEPNMLARALVSKREFRIAALIPDASLDDYWAEPAKGIRKAEAELRQYGLVVYYHIFNQFDVNSFKEEAEKLSGLNYDGILLAPVFYRESLTFLNRWKRDQIPFNLFNTHIPDYEPLSYIGQDSYQSGVVAAKLLHYGYLSSEPISFIIAHIDEDVANSSHLIKKEQGFMDYFDTADTPFVKVVRTELHKSSDQRIFAQQLDELLAKNPDARGIFVSTSRAYAVADYLENNPQHKLRLIGYDLLDKNLTHLNKGTINFLINQNPKGQGYYGIQLLIEHLVFKKKINPIKYLPLDIITKENLHYYIESEI
ncbi:LacI family DNA-binding transcriptional regulator [uncultured Sunxiuqinia sp.]|uniref:LacI family DNA-binding transcriptional regulator n=1 Tax=Sunxiuqinia rutila TaxID=1397841 RepID=UPI00262DC061|nr:substrate-binding domain-containing protein [uncultured Sunxiuqinia sp.]